MKESQYCVGGKAMTEDNAGEMIDHLTDYLEGIEAIANKVFKTKNGKQQVNSLLAMITSLLNSLQLKEFDRERAHRAETLAEQIDDEKFMKGIINVVIADHKVLSERIILFLRETLEWFFTSLVDVVLLLERVEATPPSDSNRLTVLDRDISSLVLRSRLQFGYRAWVDETIMHMAAVTRHSQTVDPLKVFSAVNTVLQQVNNFSYFGDINTKALPNAAAIQIAKDMQKSSSQPPPQEFFDKTSDDQLITVLFGDMITVAQRFNAAYMKANNLENIDGNFAQLMFNSLKSRSWMHIPIELMRIIVFFDSKEYSSDYYKDNLTRKLHSFVYNQVAKPMLLSVERAPLSGGRITSKSEESWADSMYVLNVTNSAEQDKVLAEMYRWSESTAQQQSSPPEQKILNILKRKTPKAKNFRHTPTTSGKRSASRKAAAPKTQAAAASAEPSPPPSVPQHTTTTTTVVQAASGGGAASNGPHTQTESGGADDAAAAQVFIYMQSIAIEVILTLSVHSHIFSDSQFLLESKTR